MKSMLDKCRALIVNIFTFSAHSAVIISGGAFTSALAGPGPDYRTIVIFGDTQKAVNGAGGAEDAGGEFDAFTDMIDWVIANKDTENIDFVLHVGDIIDTGTFLPLPAACDGATKSTTFGTCFAESAPPIGTGNQASCEAIAGCYWISQFGHCIQCGISNAVPPEWVRFNDAWSRFEPGGDLVDGIPFAIVRGNHDNIGVDTPTDLDVQGYTQYYSHDYWEALEASFAGMDRHFDHIKTQSFAGEGEAHVWQFKIGDQLVTVVGPSYEGGQQISQTQIDWVAVEVNAYNTPTILLVHDLIEHGNIRAQIVDDVTNPSPNLIQASAGHTRMDTKVVKNINGQLILQTVGDWTSGNDDNWGFFNIIRYYPATDEMEAFSYNPVTDSTKIPLSKQSLPFVDTDGDGVLNIYDLDDDGDGMTDVFENTHPGLDPLDPMDADDDLDNDGLTNLEEFNINPGLDPNDPDTDSDGIDDGLDSDPIFSNNACTGLDAIFTGVVTTDVTCGAQTSITVDPPAEVQETGYLRLISPMVNFNSGFKSGQLSVISKDPCAACPP